MKSIKRNLAFAALCFSASLLQAEMVRQEISKKGDWSVATLTEDGKAAGAEMLRQNTGKQEFHIRLRINDDGVFLDATEDWSALSEDETQAVQLRINDAKGKAAWKGKCKKIDDEDGQTWLRLALTDADSGEVDEVLLESLMEGGKTVHWSIGSGDKSAKWEFKLDGAKAAYEALQNHFMKDAEEKLDEPKAKAKGKAKPKAKAKEPVELTEHEYARPGDWGAHYFTDKDGKFVQASIIRYYDDGRMLRWTETATHFHLDLAGDWDTLKAAKKDKAGNIQASLVSTEAPDTDPYEMKGKVINDEGDKWLRFTESAEDPTMQNGLRSGNNFRFVFGEEKFWHFDLKGSHAAHQKLEECVKKHKK